MTTYSEQVARNVTRHTARAELIEACTTLASEADKWREQSGEWEAIAKSNRDLIARLLDQSERRSEALVQRCEILTAKLVPGCDAADDPEPPTKH